MKTNKKSRPQYIVVGSFCVPKYRIALPPPPTNAHFTPFWAKIGVEIAYK